MPTNGAAFVDSHPTLAVALRGRDGGATAELGDVIANCLRASTGGGDKPHVLAPICFSSKDYGADACVDLAPTLRAGGHSDSHANAGVPPAIAFHATDYKNGTFEQVETARTITTSADRTRAAPILASYAIQAGALRTNPASVPDGVGVQESIAYTLEARAEVQAVCVTGDITHTLKAEGFDASEDGTGRGQPIVAAFQSSQPGVRLSDTHATLDANNGPRRHNGALVGMAVRRLTPRECERLQGFPDDYTLIPMRPERKISQDKLDRDYLKYLERGGVLTYEQCMRAAADGPRYKALGNSWAIPKVRWIGARINAAIMESA
jgi:DNA (cytosine-5)-methyltransferase 1